MFKSLVTLTTLLCLSSASPAFAFCDSIASFFSCDSSCSGSSCRSADIEIGWRRDHLKWKLSDLHSSHGCGKAKENILFKDINSYTISGQVKWVSSAYYVRLSGEYGLSDKGRAHEHFKIDSPLLCDSISVDTSNPIKRRSEVYDFDGAVGYPFTFFNCRLSVIPLIGFSFHRQHLRVKTPDSCDSYGSYSSHFGVANDNAFIGFNRNDPFASSSDANIAQALGLRNPHGTDSYRFTWYGFYLGADTAFALDTCWTLFWNTEFNFFDNCHRKRKSWTGVYFVDDYHEKGSAYGFNNVVGVNYSICNDWYGTLSVDFNWWKAHSKHDTLEWKKVGAKIGLAYAF